MVSSCSRIWEAVKEVLCNDSPEGHLPVDLDEDDAFDTKDVLSYSFRAVHESRYVKTRLPLFIPYFCSRSEVTSCAHSSTNRKFAFKTRLSHQHQLQSSSNIQPTIASTTPGCILNRFANILALLSNCLAIAGKFAFHGLKITSQVVSSESIFCSFLPLC
jgi:hypothetical protein